MPAVLRIALPVPLPTLFDYLPPTEGSAQAGSRVWVPFGRGKLVGVVVDANAEAAVGSNRLKPVIRLLDDAPLLDTELMQTLAWAADYWLGAPGEAYANALPLALREPRSLPAIGDEYWSLSPAGQSAHDAGSRRGGSKQLLALLVEGALSAQELTERLPGWRDASRRLASTGLIERSERPPLNHALPASLPPQLNDEQQQAVAAVAAHLGEYQPFLLDGVTGSGKTEVYLALIEQVLAQGKQALLLVPEIGLAPQTVRRLRERLGVIVEVLHSNLSEGDRARAWLRARAGSARVILGTRSAVFTPLPEAGIIIVDEEHDSAYKQQEGFRYHARDLAVVRARALNVPVLLGSGTPSLESLANAEAGRYQTLHLRARPGAIRPPQVQIIDMRAQRLEHGLSPALLAAVAETVARGEQVLVFRNRRGYAPMLLCHSCGWHADCPRCDRPLTLHAGRRQLLCHHCDFRQRVPVDQPAILVGTQMLAKGHDLPNLTLVAIVGVDEGLHSVDFRAGERLAQLVVQVAGRAGRARKPGRVLLQTHQPEHPLLRGLLAHGYAVAARELLAERRQIQLPPYSHQVLLRADAPTREPVDAFLAAARAALPDSTELQIAGPMPAPMPLRAGRHRGQLLMEAASRSALHGLLRPWRIAITALPQARPVRWSLDVDPIDLY